MTQPVSPTPSVAADAKSRALRTFFQNLAIDVLLAVFGAVSLWLGDADLTSKAAWLGLGVLVGKTVIATAVSYVMRYAVPPSVLTGQTVTVSNPTPGAVTVGAPDVDVVTNDPDVQAKLEAALRKFPA